MAAATQSPPESRVEVEVRRIRALLEKNRFAEALTAAGAPAEAENRDVLYLTAVSQRYLQRMAEAMQTLSRLEAAHPEYGRLFQERGHCRRALGDLDGAIAAYRQAVTSTRRCPRLEFPAIALSDGRRGDASATSPSWAPPSSPCGRMLNEGETHAAERIVRHFLADAHGNHVEGMRLLAQIGVKLDILGRCRIPAGKRARVRPPSARAARCQAATVLTLRGTSTRTRIGQAPSRRPSSSTCRPAAYRTLEAACHVGPRRSRRRARDLPPASRGRPRPGTPSLHPLRPCAQNSRPAAAGDCRIREGGRRRASSILATPTGAWRILKTYRFTDEELERMRAEEAAQHATRRPSIGITCVSPSARRSRTGASTADSFGYYAHAAMRWEAPRRANTSRR